MRPADSKCKYRNEQAVVWGTSGLRRGGMCGSLPRTKGLGVQILTKIVKNKAKQYFLYINLIKQKEPTFFFVRKYVYCVFYL